MELPSLVGVIFVSVEALVDTDDDVDISDVGEILVSITIFTWEDS